MKIVTTHPRIKLKNASKLYPSLSLGLNLSARTREMEKKKCCTSKLSLFLLENLIESFGAPAKLLNEFLHSMVLKTFVLVGAKIVGFHGFLITCVQMANISSPVEVTVKMPPPNAAIRNP